MARAYQPADGDGAACPGESNCETWLSSALDSPVRCPGCPKRNNSTEDGGDPESASEQRLLDRAERLRRQRDSGRQVHYLLEPLEWELLLVYDEQHDAFKRAHEMRVAQMFEILSALLVKR